MCDHENLRIVIQAGCRASEESFYDENVRDKTIGNLLMRKMVHDAQHKNQTCFIWTFAKQHPTFYATPKVQPYIDIKPCNITSEKYCLLDTLQCPLRMSHLDDHWRVNKLGTQAVFIHKGSNRKPEVRNGTFTQMTI